MTVVMIISSRYIKRTKQCNKRCGIEALRFSDIQRRMRPKQYAVDMTIPLEVDELLETKLKNL